VSTPNTYLEWARTRGPRWLRGVVDGWGDRWAQSLGALSDGIATATRKAVKARLPSETPDDGVPYIAKERSLEQYPPETLDAWRERVGRAWEQWNQAGRVDGLEYQLTRYGVGSVEVLEHAVDPVTPGDGNARFVVVLGNGADAGSLPWSHQTMPFTLGEDLTLGSTATKREVEAVRGIVRKWKSAHGYTVAMLLRFVGGVVADPFWPRDPANDVSCWLGGNSTLGIGIRGMPFLPIGYRSIP
jgi:hypothetical protein